MSENEIEAGDWVRDMLHAFHRRAGHTFTKIVTIDCHKHGSFSCDEFLDADGALHGVSCPDCAEEKNNEIRLEERKRESDEYRAKVLAKKYDDACIPIRFKDRTLENYEATTDKQKHVLGFCMSYVENFSDAMRLGTSIIFSGTVGTGKTHLSAGIANAVIANGKTALFTTATGMVRRIRQSWRDEDETEYDAMRLFISPDLLIVDEVGVQSGTENEHQILFEILNSRYERCKPTILLTNLPITDLKQGDVVVTKGLKSYIGDRLLDRMREGGGKAFTFDWESGRRGR